MSASPPLDSFGRRRSPAAVPGDRAHERVDQGANGTAGAGGPVRVALGQHDRDGAAR